MDVTGYHISSMLRVAIKMLMGDRGKYLLLISALTFSALLITQQGSIFLGLLRWSTAIVRNTKAAVWVVDPLVEQVNEVQPMRNIDLSRVRSVQGVESGSPSLLYLITSQVKHWCF